MTAADYVNRLFDDDTVRENIGDALVRGRRAYRRARAEKAAEAVKDKRLMDHLTGAAASLQAAVRALTDKPPPKRRRPLRTALLLGGALAAGGVAIAADRRERDTASGA
jgi:hypothetical protein